MWQSSVLAYSFRLSCIRIFWIDSLFHSHTIQVFIFDTYFPAALSFILTMSREQNTGSVLQEHCKLSQIGDKYANSPRLSRAPARVVKYGRCLENARGESILFCNVPAHKAARCYTLCFGVVAKQVACSGFIRASDENSCLLLLEIRLMMLSASQKTQTMRLTVLKICRVSFFLVQTCFQDWAETVYRVCLCMCAHTGHRKDAAHREERRWLQLSGELTSALICLERHSARFSRGPATPGPIKTESKSSSWVNCPINRKDNRPSSVNYPITGNTCSSCVNFFNHKYQQLLAAGQFLDRKAGMTSALRDMRLSFPLAAH